jgi:hypothetical protein
MLHGVLCCVLTLVFAADGDSSATGRGICQRAAAQQVLLSYLSSRQNRSLQHLSAQCFDHVYSVLMASELISRLAGDVGIIQVVMTSVLVVELLLLLPPPPPPPRLLFPRCGVDATILQGHCVVVADAAVNLVLAAHEAMAGDDVVNYHGNTLMMMFCCRGKQCLFVEQMSACMSMTKRFLPGRSTHPTTSTSTSSIKSPLQHIQSIAEFSWATLSSLVRQSPPHPTPPTPFITIMYRFGIIVTHSCCTSNKRLTLHEQALRAVPPPFDQNPKPLLSEALFITAHPVTIACRSRHNVVPNEALR